MFGNIWMNFHLVFTCNKSFKPLNRLFRNQATLILASLLNVHLDLFPNYYIHFKIIVLKSNLLKV